MDELVVVLAWAAWSGATAYFASRRGWNPLTWLGIGVLTGPIGLALVLILPEPGAHARTTAAAVVAPADLLHDPHPAARSCPRCAEPVPDWAAFCPFCGERLGSSEDGSNETR